MKEDTEEVAEWRVKEQVKQRGRGAGKVYGTMA